MPNEVDYTELAAADLNGIYDYIYRESRSAKTAGGFIGRIQATAKRFATQPKAGAKARGFFRGGRYFVVGKYVAFYRPSKEGIEVMRVLHGSMNLQRFFRGGDS